MLNGSRYSKIVTVGAGAVGKFVAASLSKAGYYSTLLVRRQEQARAILDRGITVMDGETDVITVPVVTDPSQLQPELVIVTVKSFDTEAAARQIKQIPGSPLILSLQNGLDNAEVLSTIFDEKRILSAITTYGFTSISDWEVAARGIGELVIGGHSSNESSIAQVLEIFRNAGWHARQGDNMQKEIWLKALINIGINPLTAIHRVVNGDIFKQTAYRETAIAAVQEAGLVASRLGILTIDDIRQAIIKMLDVCKNTANNRSSMLQDIEKGNKTEIDSLNGAIVRLAGIVGMEAPVNQSLTEQIKRLEIE